MQIWCDCRVSSTSENLHPVFDNSISSSGDGYQFVDNRLMLNGELSVNSSQSMIAKVSQLQGQKLGYSVGLFSTFQIGR